MTLTMDLRHTFNTILDDFCCELEIAMELHQTQYEGGVPFYQSP